MMPNPERAVIEPEKVRDYLLSVTHPVGRFKAAFFEALGYTAADWEDLRDQLLDMARTGSASEGESAVYGQKYEVHGTLKAVQGRPTELESIWIVRVGEDFPRFVTAFPA